LAFYAGPRRGALIDAMESLQMENARGSNEPRLGLWDAVSLVIGIVVGTSIFRTSPLVFQNVGGAWQGLAAWALGGGLSLVGALCYAELATTYSRSGGDYEYLTQAYGRWAGFVFGWAQLVAVWTASVGTMAYTFGDYGVRLWGLKETATVWLAAAAVIAVALVNAAGVVAGKWTQNFLTVAKVLGLVGVVAAGMSAVEFGDAESIREIPPLIAPQETTALRSVATGDRAQLLPPFEGGGLGPIASFGLAMVFVLYAYGGWNDAAFVAAEVRNRRRNLPLALLGGVAGVTVIYLAMNAAYLAALGFAGLRQSMTPAFDAVAMAVGPDEARLVSVLVMISALGAINGMIFTGSRVFAVFGADHRLFGWLNRGGPTAAPWAAIAAQSAVTLAMVFGVGTEGGRGAIDAAFSAVRLRPVPWDDYYGGFETLLAATAPVFWALFLAVGIGLMVLRRRNPERERPFSVPWYPLPPLVFCATCLFMLYSSLDYARELAVLGAAPVGVGLVIYALGRKRAEGDVEV
jgi:basic amino acid/polyamine antiporter, APA family